MKLIVLFIKSAETGLKQQKGNGTMLSGDNGPHNDSETLVRKTSYWLLFFLKAFEFSCDPRFRETTYPCLSYLLTDEMCSHGATFYHKKIQTKIRLMAFSDKVGQSKL